MEFLNGKHLNSENLLDRGFVEEILDSMHDWVRVSDLDGRVVFINRAMRDYFRLNPNDIERYNTFYNSFKYGFSKSDDSSMIRVSREMKNETEIEIDKKTYAVISSPFIGSAGDKEYIVEVFRDITRLKSMQKLITEQNEKFEYDLDMAKMLQRRLLPNGSPNEAILFNYLYVPCYMLGGDFIDMYNIGDSHLGVYIADVSGHGVAASILTVFLRSTISKRIKSPAEALEKLYHEFKSSNLGSELYITVFYAIFDFKNKKLYYANAGHNAVPILFNKNKKNAQRLLQLSGIPISAWLDTTTYEEASVDIEPGDKLFLYTDGLVEVADRDNNRYGHDRVCSLLESCSDEHNEALNGILKDAYEFGEIKDSSEQCDDITLSFVELI